MWVNCCLAETISVAWDTTATIIPLPQACHSGEHGNGIINTQFFLYVFGWHSKVF